MSNNSNAHIVTIVLLQFAFLASKTCLTVCRATSITERNANYSQEGSSLTRWRMDCTQGEKVNKMEEDGLHARGEGDQGEWNANYSREGSGLTTWRTHYTTREEKVLNYTRAADNSDKKQKYARLSKSYGKILKNYTQRDGGARETNESTSGLSERYGRMLSTRYTKETIGGGWPRGVGVKQEEVSFNVSKGGGERKSKSVLGRIYEKLFAITHARLHPVHHRPVRVIVVDQSGHGDSPTLQGAIDMVRLDNKWRIQIIIRPGIYREKVYVPYRKPFITFQGSGSGVTVITWNARAGDKSQGGEILGTFGSASVAIDSDYFVARDITFQNTSPSPLPGAQGMQAVALRISGDKAAFIDCRMLGAQDTLFDHVGRHFFLRCYIEGAIDFIFGDGRSLYLNCELHANAVSYGAVAASQRNSPNDNTGFSFVQCKITGKGLLYLGRAWGQYARILFAFSYFEDIIIPDGWYDWGDTSRRETVFFGEYKCWGPGSQPRWRVSWSRQLTFQEARPFLSLGFINGHKWLNILA